MKVIEGMVKWNFQDLYTGFMLSYAGTSGSPAQYVDDISAGMNRLGLA